MSRGQKIPCSERENSYGTEQSISVVQHIKGTILVLLENTNLEVYIYVLYHIFPPLFLLDQPTPSSCFLLHQWLSFSFSLHLPSAVPPSSWHSTHTVITCLLQMIIFPSASQLQISITVSPFLKLFFIEFHQHKAIVNTSVRNKK